jgi:hypothetical protein
VLAAYAAVLSTALAIGKAVAWRTLRRDRATAARRLRPGVKAHCGLSDSVYIPGGVHFQLAVTCTSETPLRRCTAELQMDTNTMTARSARQPSDAPRTPTISVIETGGSLGLSQHPPTSHYSPPPDPMQKGDTRIFFLPPAMHGIVTKALDAGDHISVHIKDGDTLLLILKDANTLRVIESIRSIYQRSLGVLKPDALPAAPTQPQ